MEVDETDQALGTFGRVPTEFLADLNRLRAYPGKFSGGIYTRKDNYVFVACHTWAGGAPDGGEGWFAYDLFSQAPDNGGTVIKPHDVASSSPGRWVRVFAGAVNVRWFGARGDYDEQSNSFADDSDAIENAFAAVFNTQLSESGRARKPSLYFPPGTYRITRTAVLSRVTSIPANGFKIHGAGWRSSVLLLDTPSEAWFYDNGVGNPCLFFMQFEDLGFAGVSDASNGFRLWSQGHEQCFRFSGCSFFSLGKVIQVDGTGNAAENQFINCSIASIYDAVWVFNNPQSVANEFHSTDLVNIFGDVVRVESGGGGSFRMFGGTLVFNDHPSGRATWLVNVLAEPTSLGNNNDFLFYGTKHEMHGNNTGLVYHDDAINTPLKVVFDKANFSTTTGPSRVGVRIKRGDRVAFDRCAIPAAFTYEVATTTFGNVGLIFGENGSIEFVDCEIPEDLPSLVNLAGPVGQVRARGCRFPGVGSIQIMGSDGIQYDRAVASVAADFDLNTMGMGYCDQSGSVKFVQFSKWPLSAPIGNGAGDNRYAVLPPGALVLSAIIRKRGGGGSTAPYQFELKAGPQYTSLGTSALYQKREEIVWTPQLNFRMGTGPAASRVIELSVPAVGDSEYHELSEAMLLYI